MQGRSRSAIAMLRASKASARGRWRRLQATLPFCPIYTPSWGGAAPAASWGWGSHHASATHACKVVYPHSVNSRAGSLKEGLLRQPMLSPVSTLLHMLKSFKQQVITSPAVRGVIQILRRQAWSGINMPRQAMQMCWRPWSLQHAVYCST